MKKNLHVLSFLFLAISLLASGSLKAQVIYDEAFTVGVNATHSLKWETFRQALTPRVYNKLIVKKDGVALDSCVVPSIVQAIAQGLNTANTTNPLTATWVDGANTWYLGNCGNSVEFGLAQGMAYSPCACAMTKVIRASCVTCGTNWGGWGTTATCPGPNPFNIRVEFWYGFPCDDTPKTDVAGPKVACPNKPFELSPSKFYADAEYKWEYSTDGVKWSNFIGSVDPNRGAIVDSIIAKRWYRLTVKCLTNPQFYYTTKPHLVDVAPFYYCYCDNAATLDNGANVGSLYILSNKTGDTVLDKGKLVTGTGLPVYSNALAKKKYTPYHDSLAWPCLYRDTSYKFIINQIHAGGVFVPSFAQVYIDYNRDGLYNPSTERVFVKGIDGSGSPVQRVEVIGAVPALAEIGPTGMRVVISASQVVGAPCDTLSGYGEVEDYIVNICHRPCDNKVIPGLVVSTDTSMCTGYEYTLTDTTYERTVSAFNRSWQVSGDNITWSNLSNTLNKDTLQKVFTGQPLYYRLRTICLPTSDTDYSAPTLINIKPGYKCYCYSKATGGLASDSSDIGGVTLSTYERNDGGPHLLNIKAERPRTDFTDITPLELFADSMYKFTVYHTMPVVEHGDAKVTIFMDFDNDHEYDIPSERVYTGYTTIGNHTLIDNILIPMKAITDVPTGMRVILNNNIGPNDPSDKACGPYISGETEDYMVVFRKKWAEGVESVSKLTGFNVTPNPTSGKFYISFNTNVDAKEVRVKITSVTGQVIEQQVHSYSGGMLYKEVDMTNRAKGVYFVEVTAGEEVMMKKLVVQ